MKPEITILPNGDHQIIDEGFLIIVPRSSIDAAQALLKENKLNEFHVPSSKYKNYYFEISPNPKESEFKFRARFWPAMFGYNGRLDGHVLFTDSTNDIDNFLEERLKELSDTMTDEHVKTILGKANG